jgi:hypothetical protein
MKISIKMENRTIKYDVREALEKYMPSFLKLIGNKNISWVAINSRLQNHIQNTRDELQSCDNDELVKDATFYSFLVDHIQGKKETLPMFDFFEKTFAQLNERLQETEIIHLHKMAKAVFIQF